MGYTRLRRAAATIGAALLLLVLAGATYQGVATALERRRFARPGGMVDAGGHQLHIYCVGSGSPVVVLEAPAAGMTAAWGAVQPQVAQVTRVCSYDRAGLGWSERGDGPYDPRATADELHTLLKNANEEGPFILAGHGIGAAFAKVFAARYTSDTAALILVDPPDGDRSAEPGAHVRFAGALPWLARTGVLRASDMLSRKAAGIPEPSAGALCAFLNRPDHLSRTADELARWDDVLKLASDAQVSRTVPIVHVAGDAAERIAFLTSASKANSVVRAILTAVANARRVTDAGVAAR